MQFAYDLQGHKLIERDVPVYDATNLAQGELLMLGTTDPDSDADMGICFVTAYTGANTEAADALGILNETTYDTVANGGGGTAPTRTPTSTSGVYYGKAIINPFAVYRCEYNQTNVITITTGQTTTTVTVTSIEDDLEAGWIYFVGVAAGGAIYKLRTIAEDTTNTLTVDSALTTTTSDTLIKIFPKNHRITELATDAKTFLSQAAAGDGVKLHVLENWIKTDAHYALEMLRWEKHAGLNGLSGAKFYADIMMLDHVYNNS